jgi:hypothetical protein
MIVWLWDAGNAAGVTDNESRAREAATVFVLTGRATSARVEQAQFVSGIRALNPGYARLGQGWTARPGEDGRVRWVPLSASPEQEAS